MLLPGMSRRAFRAFFIAACFLPFCVAAQDRKLSVKDYDVVIPDEKMYDVVWERDYCGYILVQKGGKYGVLGRNLKEIIPCKYDNRIDFTDGYAIVESNFRYGLFDSLGNVVLPCSYSGITRDFRANGGVQFSVYDQRKCLRFFSVSGALIPCDSIPEGALADTNYYSAATSFKESVPSIGQATTYRKIYRSLALDTFGYCIASDDSGRYGVLFLNGKQMLPFEYDDYFISSIPDHLCLKKKQFWGCIKISTGQVVMPFEYDKIKSIVGAPPMFYREKGEKHELVDLKYQVWDTKRFSIVRSLDSDVFEATIPCEYGIRRGCVNRNCDTLLRFADREIKDHYNGYFRVRLFGYDLMEDSKGNHLPYKINTFDTFKDGLVELINPERESCRPFYNYPKIYMDTFCRVIRKYPQNANYQKIDCFHNGLARVVDEEGYIGYIDYLGKVVVPCDFDDGNEFFEGRALVGKNAHWQYINTSGEVISDSIFFHGTNFEEGRACVKYTSSTAGYIDTNGRMVIEPMYDDCTPYFNGFSSVKKNARWGLINRSGRLVIDCLYDCPLGYSEGLVVVCENKRWSFVDTFGRKVMKMPDSIIECGSFSHGTACVSSGKKFGLINTAGKITLPIAYEDLECWHEKFIKFAVDKDKYGLMTRDGRRITPPVYRDLYFSGKSDVIVVSHTFGYGLIDSKGRELVPAVFEEIHPDYFGEGLMMAKLNRKCGYITLSGAVRVPFIYDDATVFSEGVAAVKKDGKWGLINKDGNITVWLR